MAHPNISRSSSRKAIVHVLSLFSLLLLIQRGNAYQFKVGGSGSWSSPPDPNTNTYNQWAERSRFQIGDSILFVYSADKDSVLEVNKDDYNSCNTDNPLKKFSDGHTEYKFDHSGPHYFISGVKDNCVKNEKLIVVVMANRSHLATPPSNGTAAAPAPSNETTASPPSPTAEVPPSPAPSGEEAPSPPSPAPSGEETPPPSSAPSEQSKPKKSGGSSIVKSFIAPTGAFVGSCLLMVF